MNEILHGDNLDLLKQIPSESVSLIYIDPPFNTGKKQQRKRIKAEENESDIYFDDTFGENFTDYIRPRLQEAYRILNANGSLFFHIDWREAARSRLLLDEIFGGDEHCKNEIIWAYDYGGRGKNKWPTKHDNIYWFVKNPNDYIFNYDDIERIPYMAPGLVGKEKAERGKVPTDVWWQTIVPTNGKEKVNYPTQKPIALLHRIVQTHSRENDIVLDFFAGSGTTGHAAKNLNRRYILIDKNPDAIKIMQKRLTSP